MADEPRIIETDQFRIEVGNYVTVGDLSMPSYIQAEFFGFDEPDHWARIELRDNVPRIVELGWRSTTGAREVQSKDVRDVEFSYLIDTLYTAAVQFKSIADHSPEGDVEFDRFVRNQLQERRTGRRRITRDFLQQVAAVYRANYPGAPTQAVARTFGVRDRQATKYVEKARERGLLPETKQGKAQA